MFPLRAAASAPVANQGFCPDDRSSNHRAATASAARRYLDVVVRAATSPAPIWFHFGQNCDPLGQAVLTGLVAGLLQDGERHYRGQRSPACDHCHSKGLM
jgi:hypothetical protein